MDLDKIIFLFFLSVFFNFFFIKYYKFFFLRRIVDKEFNKPQAFHCKPAIRTGGITILFFLIIFSIFYKNEINSNYFSSIIVLSIIFFIIGFLEDIKISTKPTIRLFFLFLLSFFTLFYFDIHILKTQVEFINYIIYSNKFFSIIFVCFCLMFIINGCNFIDGFNGLLLIHSIIILVILYYSNLLNFNNSNNQTFLIFFILILISLLLFNFPNAKIFLGDSGAYIIGIILSIVIIEISNFNPTVSPFFFANLLFYIFFEVIFSFFRKFIFEKKSPFEPDKEHLHMLLFIYLKKRLKDKVKANFSTSLIVNISYLILTFPNLIYYKHDFFCKTYFFFFIIFLYFFLFIFKKNYF